MKDAKGSSLQPSVSGTAIKVDHYACKNSNGLALFGIEVGDALCIAEQIDV